MTDNEAPKTPHRSKKDKPWTFITNHAAVLSLLSRRPRMKGWELAQEVGITERSVRLIIDDLEKGGYIGKIREGRGIRYVLDDLRPLRHRTQRDVAVRHLISVLSGKKPSPGQGS